MKNIILVLVLLVSALGPALGAAAEPRIFIMGVWPNRLRFFDELKISTEARRVRILSIAPDPTGKRRYLHAGVPLPLHLFEQPEVVDRILRHLKRHGEGERERGPAGRSDLAAVRGGGAKEDAEVSNGCFHRGVGFSLRGTLDGVKKRIPIPLGALMN